MNWVLKLELRFEYDLCPSLILGVSKNPTLVVLSLNHEYAIARNQNVVYLCRAITMFKRDVIQKVIARGTKVLLNRFSHEHFATILRRIGSVSPRP